MDEDYSSFTVLHIPHSSRAIPGSVRALIALSDDELDRELLQLTDSFTDEIFDIDEHNAKRIVFGVSRIVVDPERFLQDDYEPMAECGMGAVYTKTIDGETLRPNDDDYRNELIEAYYKPHHDALTKAVDEVIKLNGFCFIIDCHSFPSTPLPCEPDRLPDRPDICIGADDFHTPDEIADIAVRLFTESGFRTEINRPYSGAIVPMDYFGNDKRVVALLVEINRALYMDEKTGEKLSTFDEFAARIKRIILELIADVREYRDEIETRT